MPNWQPHWDDVQFDHGETNEAVVLCQGALATLADRHGALQGPYLMACLHWRGVKRYRFDAEWGAMHAQAETVAEQLRAHIVKLRHESEVALAELRMLKVTHVAVHTQSFARRFGQNTLNAIDTISASPT